MTKLKNVLIEVSTGYERTGIYVEEEAKISKILSRLLAAPDQFTFMGIYNHCGHTYLRNKDSNAVEKIEEMNKETVAKLKKLRDHLEDQFEDAAPIFIGYKTSICDFYNLVALDQLQVVDTPWTNLENSTNYTLETTVSTTFARKL